jgi:hypothetical protein
VDIVREVVEFIKDYHKKQESGQVGQVGWKQEREQRECSVSWPLNPC